MAAVVEGGEAMLNINVGVMGHVDSGKTSLVKALSTQLSTASLDRNPQSQARGITIDLGFSAFSVPMPEHLVEECGSRYSTQTLQLTLVDCPGHASLIRTIIGGAQIIDMMLLVVDAVKGIQTQTAECLVIGEITTNQLIIVLNKVDTIPAAEREAVLAKTEKKIRLQLASSKFANAPIVSCAAAIGGEKVAALGGKGKTEEVAKKNKRHEPSERPPNLGLAELTEVIQKTAKMPNRDTEGPFYFAIDHCFAIRGQGTVVTGTVLRGKAALNDMVELPAVGETKKVKSMQMFKKPVKQIACGDRAGMCLAQLDSSVMERGIVAAPGSVPLISSAIACVSKVRFFRDPCATDRKYHVTVGHTTVVATAVFFGAAELRAHRKKKKNEEELAFSLGREYAYQPELFFAEEASAREPNEDQWCLLRFEVKIRCQQDALIIGSRLEVAENTNNSSKCRIAFHGRLLAKMIPEDVPKLKIFKLKQKVGIVSRLGESLPSGSTRKLSREVIGRDLFKKEANMGDFVGMRIQAQTGELGVISSAFGKSDKFKVTFDNGGTAARPNAKLFLCFKKYLFSTSKAMHQDDDCLVSEEELLDSAEAARSSQHSKEDKGRAVREDDEDDDDEEATVSPASSSTREGVVERLKGDPDASARYPMVIAEGFFAAEDDQRPHVGARVELENGDVGTLAGPFAKAGKSKVEFDKGTTAEVGAKMTLHLAA